jgi:hypothetical protein
VNAQDKHTQIDRLQRTVGDYLRSMRGDLSLRDLVVRAPDLTIATLSRMENGESDIRLSVLAEVVMACGYTLTIKIEKVK